MTCNKNASLCVEIRTTKIDVIRLEKQIVGSKSVKDLFGIVCCKPWSTTIILTPMYEALRADILQQLKFTGLAVSLSVVHHGILSALEK